MFIIFQNFKSLKEKRKGYQTTLNDSSYLDGNTSDKILPIDRSKIRMRDLLYYNNKNRYIKLTIINNFFQFLDSS